ncbi:Stress-response A/B barrel domain-containing protein [Mycena venus]|uniref:Stress-response A/B barrel domain-containing protein n=1 Tax=Mycena venus TaxID=2733690 RepID=A0A8H7DBC0_9AGAR|nr:Stress-response A/B barrel domain-containing protein [Mycena venus]
MAIQHFTFAKFRSGTTPQQKEDAYKTVYLLLAAALAIPGINAFKVGPPIDKRGTRGYDFALTVEFEDLQAFTDYIPHAHHRLVSDFINGFSEGTPLSYQIDTARVAKL